uniref:Uncharacterized protein n=1 Tax=Setaria italica TaxID=4555 RepID=K3ZB97_SETIT
MSLLQAPSSDVVPRRTNNCQATPAVAVRYKQPTRQKCNNPWPPPKPQSPPRERSNPRQACHLAPCRLAAPQARCGEAAATDYSLP